MASANVTIGDAGGSFEVDTTQRVATLTTPGGALYNATATTFYINVDGATCATSEPLGAGGRSVPTGAKYFLPNTCKSFTFKAGGTTYFTYSKG